MNHEVTSLLTCIAALAQEGIGRELAGDPLVAEDELLEKLKSFVRDLEVELNYDS